MPDAPVEPKAGDPYPSGPDMRASRLEDDVHDMKATMGRLEMLVVEIKATLDATLPHLATKSEVAGLRADMKADMAELRTEMRDELAQFRLETRTEFGAVRLSTEQEFARLRADIADKPSKTYMWGALTALLTAYACGLAALAILK